MRHFRLALTTALALGAVAISAQRSNDPIGRIMEADIKRDLFALAGDEMRGREGGTLDEMTASVWLAERAREAGLQPAGENGTYFQFFPLERYRASASSPVTIGGRKLVMGRDVVTDAVVLADLDATLVEVVPPSPLPEAPLPPAYTGKAVVVRYSPATPASGAAPAPVGPGAQVALRTWTRNVQRLVTQGSTALVVIVPDNQKEQWERASVQFPRGTYALDPDGTAEQRTPTRGASILYVRESALGGTPAADARLVA